MITTSIKRLLISLSFVIYHLSFSPVGAQNSQYVDPRIGSVGVGRTFPGPCMPFGMAKPGPDCGVLPNAGWAPMPAAVTGFSQTHVSGTGGGQKYGNILVQPYSTTEYPGNSTTDYAGSTDYSQRRTTETIELGYYAATFENGIRTEVTTDERCAFYRFHYPEGSSASLFVDATHYLGKDSIPDLRERQQFVGAEVEVVSDQEVCGFSRIRGGWNNGDAYTVFFTLRSDRPFTAESDGQRAWLHFSDTLAEVKIGISYVSTQQARRNIPSVGFDEQLIRLRQTWDKQLSKIQITGDERQKRMFYTALYHTMLMPVCKTGENPKWTDSPYYDDYYAIWDTYRTSTPLLTLLYPEREVELVNSLLNIYVRDGYMPDARSGDCNGRTQGGSNAEVVIADAYAKGLQGIDYELALKAMLHDGEADPGDAHERHGRGGLREYITLGYIPYGIARAGTRTVEYSFNDWCIAQVARGLGREDVWERYMQRSSNWRNLWRSDYEYDGMKGFIMPRDSQGEWLDSVPWGHSQVLHPTLPYTPMTKVAPWYLPWWDTFFYEATSQEYSLNIPHDVPGLISACGGEEQFRQRLNRFFERGYYNVQNEPSFLTPTLYHWIGRPDLSSRRIHQIIADHYTDLPDGLPGNDDSGAMSSWLALHMMGLYPNAGTDYYLLNVPLLSEYTLTLSNGRQLHVSRRGKGDAFGRVTLNGRELADARLHHADLLQGGDLLFETQKSPKTPNTQSIPTSPPSTPATVPDDSSSGPSLHISFTLNRQFRTWPLTFSWQGDTLTVTCKQTTYRLPRHAVEQSDHFCWHTPQQDDTVWYNEQGTFAFISRRALTQLRQQGTTVYDGITWRLIDENENQNQNQNGKEGRRGLLHVRADIDRTEMWIADDDALPLVVRMKNNPLGIDWTILP